MNCPDKRDNPQLVDDNPTQIADVETAVEREGALARRGTEIDVSDFVYQSEASFTVSDLVDSKDISSLIDEEIERVEANERKG